MGRNLSAAVHAVTSGAEASRILKRFQPDIAIGTGGYVCGPVLRRAAKRGIPVLVHESNAFPGVTVKLLAKDAAAVMIADEAARKYLPEGCRVVVTGNPLRPGFAGADREKARRELGLDSRPVVLSFGGSLGADRINAVMAAVMARSFRDGGIQHIHGTGRSGYEKTVSLLRQEQVPLDGGAIRVREYIEDMSRCMAAADLVISPLRGDDSQRTACRRQAVHPDPSPHVAENHQYHNAMALVHRGAAVCLEEKDLTADSLWGGAVRPGIGSRADEADGRKRPAFRSSGCG